MPDKKDMQIVMDKFFERSTELYDKARKQNIHPIKLMLDLQIDLMIHIINKKQLWEYGLDKLMSNMVLSILDEVYEYLEWNEELGYGVYKRSLEASFEIIDAIHFVLQLALLSVVKHKGINLKDVQSHKEEIVNEAFDILLIKELNDYNERIPVLDILHQTTKVLEHLHWKHWKTYKEFNYEAIKTELNILFSMFVYQFNIESKWVKRKIGDYSNLDLMTLLYITKNIENIDRQNRGY